MNMKIVSCLAPLAFIAAMPAAAEEGASQLQTFTKNVRAYVPFDATATVTVECPDPAAEKWLASHLKDWYGEQAPKVTAAQLPALKSQLSTSPEAYAAKVDASGVKIAANTLAGTRWAAYTLRQLAIAKRGTFKTEGMILPTLSISDSPHLAFRAVHLCWFPEVRPQQIERAIRLAALLKFNYAIIESWGVYRSERHPWWPWPQANMTKEEVRRLVAIGKDLGITLIPQINCLGHASSSRSCTIKHSVLDLHPEYEPLFEPGGSHRGDARELRQSAVLPSWMRRVGRPDMSRVRQDVEPEAGGAAYRGPCGFREVSRCAGYDLARHVPRQQGSPLDGLYQERRQEGA